MLWLYIKITLTSFALSFEPRVIQDALTVFHFFSSFISRQNQPLLPTLVQGDFAKMWTAL